MLFEAGENQFYGVVCGQGGIRPDPNSISALKQMSAPTSRQKLTLLSLDLANYIGPFISNLGTLTAPLRELGKPPILLEPSTLIKKHTTKSRIPSIVRLL